MVERDVGGRLRGAVAGEAEADRTRYDTRRDARRREGDDAVDDDGYAGRGAGDDEPGQRRDLESTELGQDRDGVAAVDRRCSAADSSRHDLDLVPEHRVVDTRPPARHLGRAPA